MTESAATSIEQTWESLEEPAMADLGFSRVRDDQYECRLDDAGTVVGRITLPLERHGSGGIKLGYPAIEAVHLPTARLLAECMPPFAPDDGAVTARLIDLPLSPEEKAGYLAIAAAGPADVPAAVGEVAGLVRDVLLPWLRDRGNLDAIRAQLAEGRPFERPYPKSERLRRLTAACCAAGDLDAATQAYNAFLEVSRQSQGMPALDEVNDHFAGAARDRLEAMRIAAPRTPNHAAGPPAGTEAGWLAAERDAMAGLGFRGPGAGGRYQVSLDQQGDWLGLVALPKSAASDGGVEQLVSYAAVIHRPTETLLLALRGTEARDDRLPITTGVEVRDFPDLAGAPMIDNRILRSVGEVPAAVATTMALVAEQYLPWLRGWGCDIRALAAHFRGDPTFTAGSFLLRHIERRIVTSHLAGDAASAKRAFDTYLDIRQAMPDPGPALSTTGVLRMIAG